MQQPKVFLLKLKIRRIKSLAFPIFVLTPRAPRERRKLVRVATKNLLKTLQECSF